MNIVSNAYLVMRDGRLFKGKPFGAIGETSGETVFNTSMMGYQEILTDPSYAGQIITMTYPLIGNYGVNEEDIESREIFADGFIVKEESRRSSSWRSHGSLGDYLRHHNVVGIQGIDTRALTRHIRLHGAMPGLISSVSDDIEELKRRAANLKGTEGIDLVSRVTYDRSYEWNGRLWDLKNGFDHKGETSNHRVVVIDLGVKQNILRYLKGISCCVMVVPATVTLEEILLLDPDGIFLSNGPGDPSAAQYVADKVKKLIGHKPIFGICLGHQMLSLALGAKTYKLKFGHHGGNQPVKDLKT
ncbi:Carbamoyl-phosphate synthase small chain, partial [hydrothermal vent metagenome]